MRELHQIVSLLRDIRLTQIEGSGGSGGSGGGKPSGVTSESVEFLPDPLEAKEGIIYVVPSKVESDSDKYEEYIMVNGSWERLGNNPLTIEEEDVFKLFDPETSEEEPSEEETDTDTDIDETDTTI